MQFPADAIRPKLTSDTPKLKVQPLRPSPLPAHAPVGCPGRPHVCSATSKFRASRPVITHKNGSQSPEHCLPDRHSLLSQGHKQPAQGQVWKGWKQVSLVPLELSAPTSQNVNALVRSRHFWGFDGGFMTLVQLIRRLAAADGTQSPDSPSSVEGLKVQTP